MNTEQGEVDFLVYFSDGYGTFPEEQPEYPVFFVLTEQELPDWVIPILPDWVIPILYKDM